MNAALRIAQEYIRREVYGQNKFSQMQHRHRNPDLEELKADVNYAIGFRNIAIELGLNYETYAEKDHDNRIMTVEIPTEKLSEFIEMVKAEDLQDCGEFDIRDHVAVEIAKSLGIEFEYDDEEEE